MTETLYSRWMRRLIVERLGLAAELWSIPADHPARARLRPFRERANRKQGRTESLRELNSSLDYSIYRSLLQDLIDAAGAVEKSVERLDAAADLAQAWVTANLPPQSPGAAAPTYGEWVSTEEVRLAYLELANVLVWVRAVDERIDRVTRDPLWRAMLRRIPFVRRLIGRRGRVGLLPCVAPGALADEVSRALDAFRKRTADARALADYALHAAFLPGGGTATGLITKDRRIRFRVPDRRRRRVEIFDEFTFAAGREARTYSAELLAATQELVDQVLDAFARAQPARFRT